MLRILRRNVRELVSLVDTVLKENVNQQVDGRPVLAPRMIDLWPLAQSLVLDLQGVAAEATDAAAQRRSRRDRSCTQTPACCVASSRTWSRMRSGIRRARRCRSARAPTERTAAPSAGCATPATGFRRQMIERIFDKGESSAEDEGGLGLGLTIVKTFIEAHGGTVRVESREGRRIDVPLHAPRTREGTDARDVLTRCRPLATIVSGERVGRGGRRAARSAE